ncbi:hypothetical protein H4J02_12310 [Protaetiibacter sp. SSC-01]|uniref:hypothetical protein n=1 Tax=Protaetiibacter sp. SSC-01 TaxID=2759943 RepID=UPI001656AD1E|nr:hypothetical protein [Protaetiibacter sp. SSC-01]QNO37213.1 hypothetical protein H4J02_12310 [Protaetiibacter sp. SSC-01]
MSSRTSAQQLDPLAAVTAQMFVWGLTATAFALAVSLSVIHVAEYNDRPLLVLALLAIAAACLVVILASSPSRAPFTRADAVLLHVLCLAAVLLEAAAQWETNATVRSDWAPLAYALLVLVTGCYRPAREILVMGVVDAFIVGAITVAGQVAFGASLVPLVYAGLTAGPMLAATVGAATFARIIVIRLLEWRDASRGARAELAETLRAEVREQLREERIALVEAEVGPFLRGLLEAGSADAEDAERARALSEALRRELVAEVDGRWLSDLVWRLHDPEGLAGHMDETQHATIEAACAALADRRLSARLSRSGDRIRFTLAWDRTGKRRLGPELQALIRAAFPGALVRPNSRMLDLEFEPLGVVRGA